MSPRCTSGKFTGVAALLRDTDTALALAKDFLASLLGFVHSDGQGCNN